MNRVPKKANQAIRRAACGLLAAALGLAPLPSVAEIHIPLLRDIIIEYHTGLQDKKHKTDGYRGEEGILMVRPDVALSLGLVSWIHADFYEAVALYDEADRLLRQAFRELKPAPDGSCTDAQIRRVAEYAAGYNRSLRGAREKMLRYQDQAALEKDQRRDREVSQRTMDRLLGESFAAASNNLRDALGRFYNTCDGVESERPLNPKNIRFVNHVFREFTARAPKEWLAGIDLDRSRRNGSDVEDESWKAVLGDAESPYAPFLEAAREASGGYPTDPLLFMALIRQESNFNPEAVSHMGAAGLTQIMPATGRDLGMKNVHSPPYLLDARALLDRERESRRRARALLREIRSEDMLDRALQACGLMQSAGENRAKWMALHERYRQELREAATDDRLDPAKSIRYGYEYFSRMMRLHRGDISLALAAYNAGPHRVKEYQGIPPFAETVDFRNRVLAYYDDYLKRLKVARGAGSGERPGRDAAGTGSGGG